jgi:hypothetical protein
VVNNKEGAVNRRPLLSLRDVEGIKRAVYRIE